MPSILERYVELHPTSQRLHQRAASVFPDGVTHDIRFAEPFPIYAERANGSHKWDVDGNEIVDFVMGHGALLLGHGHPAITDAVAAQLERGTHYGASHELEVRWGEAVQQIVPSVEHLRFTSSGTEATMMALRLARAHTGREKILRLREHFHGWNDSVTGQPPREETMPRSPGLPAGILDASVVIEQNDVDALERTIGEHGREIAAMIFEGTGLHWGTEPIEIDYVRRARELTREHDIVLIFDEVITGFRVAPGGAQEAYGVTPDMTTMAKIVAGGLPGGCVGGRAGIIDQIAFREGRKRIAHPGTYNANPLSAAAGATCLGLIADGEAQRRASETAATLARRLNAVFREASVPGAVYGQASMLHVALGMEEQPADGYGWGWHAMPVPPPPVARAAAQALQRGMLNEGIDLMGGAGMMVSSVHTGDDVDRVEVALRRALDAMKADGAA